MTEFASVEAVARRYAHRAGCRFVGAQEVGVAVYVMDLRVILIEPREIPPVDEFLLRAMGLSVGLPSELSRFLGLDLRTVENRLVELRRAELIELEPVGTDGAARCRLTIKGKAATDTLQQAELSEVTLPRVAYHGFLRRPLVIEEDHLLRPQDLRKFDLQSVPAIPGRPPRPEEIRLAELSEVIRRYWTRRKKGKTPELVSVRSVLKNVRTMYQRAVLLQYELIGRKKQQQLAFAIDGVVQDEYEKAFAACKGPERVPQLLEADYKSTPALAAEFVMPHLVKALGPIADVDELQEKIDVLDGAVAEKEATVEAEDRPDTKQVLRAELEREKAEKAELERKLAQRSVRRLKTYDCGLLLRSSVRVVKTRLVIVSAFLSTEVVDAEFLKHLEEALARGVKVWIAYGMGNRRGHDNDRESSPGWKRAEEDLQSLQQKYPGTFQLKDRGNTHEKILLRDTDFVVSGSFNWLSFRGERGRRFRYEDAIQMSESTTIEEYFADLTGRFKK